MTDVVTQLLLKHLPTSAKKNRNGFKFNCPMCKRQGEMRNDTKQRGGLKLEYTGFVYNCFNCKFSTGYTEGNKPTKKCLDFLKTLGADITEIPIEIRFSNNTAVKKRVAVDVPDFYPTVKLPQNSKPILDLIQEGFSDPDFNKVVEYISVEVPYLLFDKSVMWSPSETLQMNKRFILPFYWNNKVVGWTARYYDKKPPSGIAKYMMERPENYIFNMDVLHDDSNVVIAVEGPTDAKAIGGIALLTNTVNEIEAEILIKSRKKVIVVPDMEETGLRLVQDAGKYGFAVSLPKWPKHIKDCAQSVKECGKLFTLYTIYNSVYSGSAFDLETRFKTANIMRT